MLQNMDGTISGSICMISHSIVSVGIFVIYESYNSIILANRASIMLLTFYRHYNWNSSWILRKFQALHLKLDYVLSDPVIIVLHCNRN